MSIISQCNKLLRDFFVKLRDFLKKMCFNDIVERGDFYVKGFEKY